MFGFNKKVEETRTKVNAAADEAASLSKEAREHINELHKTINEFTSDAQKRLDYMESQTRSAIKKLTIMETIKISLLAVCAIGTAVIAVNSCRD